MPDDADDRSLAPRRTLSGPVLPPPPPELEEQARKAEADATAARESRERKEAEKQAKAKSRADAREAQAKAKADAKREKAEAARRSEESRQASTGRESQAARSGQVGAADSGAAGQAQQPSGGTTTLPVAAPAVAAGSVVGQGGRGSRENAARSTRRPAPRRTRRAQLRLVQVDAWSVMKTAFLLSIALGIVLVVAVAIIMSVLSAAGVWTSINSIVQQAVGTEGGQTFDVQKYVGASRILGFTMIVAVVDVILITAIATLGAFLYNLSAALLGGIEVTLAEDG